jgi:hypothetical protein
MSIESDNKLFALAEVVFKLQLRIEALEAGDIAPPPIYKVPSKKGWPAGKKRGPRRSLSTIGDPNGQADTDSRL